MVLRLWRQWRRTSSRQVGRLSPPPWAAYGSDPSCQPGGSPPSRALFANNLSLPQGVIVVGDGSAWPARCATSPACPGPRRGRGRSGWLRRRSSPRLGQRSGKPIPREGHEGRRSGRGPEKPPSADKLPSLKVWAPDWTGRRSWRPRPLFPWCPRAASRRQPAGSAALGFRTHRPQHVRTAERERAGSRGRRLGRPPIPEPRDRAASRLPGPSHSVQRAAQPTCRRRRR